MSLAAIARDIRRQFLGRRVMVSLHAGVEEAGWILARFPLTLQSVETGEEGAMPDYLSLSGDPLEIGDAVFLTEVALPVGERGAHTTLEAAGDVVVEAEALSLRVTALDVKGQ